MMKIELENVLPREIEKRSFELITEELGERTFPEEQEPIIKRCIHTSADFDYADNLCFSEGVVEKAKEYGVPIRVGVNSGSLEKHLVEKYHGVTAEGLVESALDKIQLIEEMGYNNLVVSIKSSDVMMCVKAHELIAKKCPYPLHVGITEAGTLLAGNIKSSVGLGLILGQGIGDTIRVSLTGSPLEEITTAASI